MLPIRGFEATLASRCGSGELLVVNVCGAWDRGGCSKARGGHCKWMYPSERWSRHLGRSRVGGWVGPRHSWWLRDNSWGGVSWRCGKCFWLTELGLCQALHVRWRLTRCRRWRTIQRSWRCGRWIVLEANVIGVQVQWEIWAVMRWLDCWLSFFSCGLELLVCRNPRNRWLFLAGLDVWVTVEFPRAERGLWSIGILFGCRQSCSNEERSQSPVIISLPFLNPDTHLFSHNEF